MVRVKFLDTDVWVESVNCRVNPYVVAAVGVPLRIPVAGSSANPGGRDPPVTAQARGDTPAPANCSLYAEPTAPLGNGDAVVMARPCVMVTVMAPTAAAPRASVTCAAKR